MRDEAMTQTDTASAPASNNLTTGGWETSSNYVKYAFWLLIILSFVPLLLVDTPALTDLPGHIGRYHIALNLGQSADLQRFWDFDWKVVANLGIDLLVMPLGHFLGAERATWFIVLLIAPTMIWGIYRISVSIYGTAQYPALVAALFATAFPYQMGFVNYWLAVALGLHYFANWVKRDTRAPMTIGVRLGFAVGALLIWLCHAYGWAVTVIWIGGYEAAKILTADGWSNFKRWPNMVFDLLRRTWPVLVPFVALLFWTSGSGATETSGWGMWGLKFVNLALVLSDQDITLDSISICFVFTFLFMALVAFKWRFQYGLLISAIALLAIYLILPFRMLGSAYADLRLLPLVIMTLLLSLKPGENPTMEHVRGMRLLAIAAVAVFAARMVFATIGGLHYQAAFNSHLKALDQVERGARILVLNGVRCEKSWSGSRTQHLASLAIARKDAFVNTQWDLAGAQLLTVKFAPDAPYRVDPSQYLRIEDCKKGGRPEVAEALSKVKANQYDYLWLYNLDSRVVTSSPYRLLYADSGTALYRIDNRQLPH